MIKKLLPLILILAVAGVFLFSSLGKDLLWDWDECLYGQYAKEMISSKHFLTNIWNGYLDFQKPPLYTWLLLLPTSFALNEFTIRLFSALAALGLIAAVYLFSKKYFSDTIAILASLILLASELIVIYARHASTDVGFTLLVFLGFWAWITSHKKSRFSYLSGLLFGLAVMIKGLGSLQFLAAIFLSIFLNFRKQRLMNFLRLTAVFFAVIIPWHLAAYLTYGYDFFRVYFLENILRRSKYPIEFHRERWWFYFVLLYRELQPWLYFAVVFPLWYLFRINKFLSFKKIMTELKKKELVFTILLLIVVPLISIVRVKTKIAWYAMPLYPFIAIFLAYNIALLLNGKRFQRLIYLVMILIALDAFRLLANETRFFDQKWETSLRHEVALKTNKSPQKKLEYLVAFAERQARELLPQEEQISQTWVFGGNPCMVYYSDKKVQYYYNIEEFKKRLGKGKGLFLIENGDLKLIENQKVKVLHKNNEYTLFEKK